MRNGLIIFTSILVLGLALRLWRLNLPLLEFNPSRQIQTAEITANLIKSNFDVLHPYVNYYGNGNTKYLLAEFPIYNLIVAGFEKLANTDNEISGRAISVISFIICFLFLFLLTNDLFNQKVAHLATFFFSLSPLNVLTSRSFQPDEMMLAFSLGSIFFVYKGIKSKSIFLISVSLVLLLLAILIKPLIFEILVLPALYIFRKYHPENYLQISSIFFLIALAPMFLWLQHAALFSKEFQLGTASSFRITEFFRPELFLNFKYYSNIFGYEVNLVLLPIGLFLFALGASKKLLADQQILYLWLLGCGAYFLTFNIHIMSHEYYHLPLIPVASIFMALGFESVISNLRNLRINKTFLILILLTVSFFSALPVIIARAYKPIERFNNVVNVGKRVENLIRPDDLMIGLMDDGPSLVHYSNRTGWGFEIDPKKTLEHQKFIGLKNTKAMDPIKKLEELRIKGAVLFAVSYKAQFLANKDFAKYMYEKYRVLEETDDYVIFSLRV